MKKVDLVVFDLDNTLYDWYASFLPAFYTMVEIAVSILKCDRENLLDELRSVHVKHHDVEHPFSLLETEIVKELSRQRGLAEIRLILDPAFHAFNKARKDNLVLFPDVRRTLDELRSRQIRLVAFTDSSYFATLRRVRQLDLVNVFERIFCRAKSESAVPFLGQPSEDSLTAITTELPANETKPDPVVLNDIAKAERTATFSMAYIGDSISKDVLMAKKAGCFAIWARYGVNRDPAMYESLIRISHWTNHDILRERNFAQEASAITPDFTCEKSIAEVLTVLSGPSQLGIARNPD
jgi:phosphoglycolate phosphatase-like HAD superfamily hydrolase